MAPPAEPSQRQDHYYVYVYKRSPADGGKPYYYYERTCGSEARARDRVRELGPDALYLVNHTIRGAFY